MADTGDLELEGEDAATSSSSAQPVRKNIAITLKPGTKTHGRAKKTTGRGKKAAKQRASKEMAEQEKAQAHDQGGDMDVDLLPIKMSSSPPEPLHLNQKLRWDHQVNLIGEKVVDPLIHCCEICAMPILIFGRMIPCKHVLCFDCAKKTEKNCPRCSEAVSRIEQSALGTVFVCTYGGPKHSASGCHRTYLSQRDLQAHIDYRHLRTHHGPDPRAPSTRDYPLPPKSSPLSQRAPFVSEPPPGVAYHQRGMADSMQHPMQQMHPQPTIMAMAGMSAPQAMTAPPQAMSAQAMTAPPAHQAMSAPPAHQVPPPIQTVAAIESYHTIPVMSSSRTNLITVPVQDENNYQRIGGSPQQGAPPGHYPPPTSTTLEYIKSHPPPMSVQPPHMSVQPSIMTQPPPITSSVGPHVGPPPQGVLPPHFSSPQRPYMDELQQPQNLAFGQQGALPNAHHPWPGMSVPGPTLVQGGMALPVQANSRSAQCGAPPSGIVHNRPPNPATMMQAGMLATRPPPAGLPHQSGMPLPTGMMPPQGGMPPVGMMCGPPPQHPPTSSGLGPPSQTRYYQ